MTLWGRDAPLYEKRGPENGLHSDIEPAHVVEIMKAARLFEYHPMSRDDVELEILTRYVNNKVYEGKPVRTNSEIRSLLRHIHKNELTAEDFAN